MPRTKKRSQDKKLISKVREVINKVEEANGILEAILTKKKMLNILTEEHEHV